MNDLAITTLVMSVLALLAASAIRRSAPVERAYLWISFVAHLLSAGVMIAVTRYYYEGGDMLAYHMFGELYAARLRDSFFDVAPALLDVVLQREDAAIVPGAMMGSSTGSIQALSAFFMYFFGDSLYAVCAAIAGAAFFAKLAVYRVMKRELPRASLRWLLAACLLIPSAVFWSSGLLKEPLAVIGLGMMIHGGYATITARRYASGALWFAAGALLAGLLKPYLLPPFGLGASMWLLARGFQKRVGAQILLRTRHLVLAALVCLAAIAVTGALAPYLAPENLADEAMKLREVGARVEGGSNYSLGAPQSASLAGQLTLAPLALVTALFRPTVFEVTNPLMFINSLEMSLVVILFVLAVVRRGFTGTLRELLQSPGLLFCAAFVLALAIGVGLTTTNLGTLSRYRMPLMPFFGVLLVTLSSPARAARAARSRVAFAAPPGARRL